MFMEDVGSMENTRGKQRDLTHRWRESSVESLGHCQPAGNRIAFCVTLQRYQGLAGEF
jgi:hypothetical protein